MKNRTLAVLFVFLLIFSAPALAISFKCWTNDEGIRECGNSLPPKYVTQRIEFLNSKSGKVSKVTAAAKTQQEIEFEKEQEKLQKKRNREIAKQKSYDEVLLKTYLSVDDLLLSLQWKITTLNSRISVAKGSIRAENVKFMEHTKQAARMERAGRKLTDDIKSELQGSRNRVKNYRLRIKQLEKEITDIHEKFSHDIDRFTVATINGLTLTLRNEDKAEELHMIQLTCTKKVICDQMWQAAKNFTHENSTLKVIFDTKQVQTTESPSDASEMAYTISRTTSTFDNIKSEKITLKIRCQPSRAGEQLCKSSKTREQLKSFKKQVQR